MYKTYTIHIWKLDINGQFTSDDPYYSDSITTLPEMLQQDLEYFAKNHSPVIDCAGYRAAAYDCCGNEVAVFDHKYQQAV